MINKVFQYISCLTILAALFLLFLLGYWSFYPYKTIKFNNTPLPVDKTEIVTGNVLYYTTDYCKFTDITPTATWSFIDSIIYTIPSFVVSPKSAGCNKLRVGIQVPFNLPEGEYYLNILYRYKVNPVRYIDVNVKTELFNVISRGSE